MSPSSGKEYSAVRRPMPWAAPVTTAEFHRKKNSDRFQRYWHAVGELSSADIIELHRPHSTVSTVFSPAYPPRNSACRQPNDGRGPKKATTMETIRRDIQNPQDCLRR